MLRALAPDDVWQRISWQATKTKESISVLRTFLMSIRKVCAETFSECDVSYCDTKIKSFLRHTEERLKRKSNTTINTLAGPSTKTL